MKIIAEKDADLAELVSALKEGKTIVYPTETCYGLGCDATNEIAVQRIFAIKGREKNKSVLMIASDADMVKQFVEWNDMIDTLARAYWPGPLTIVCPKKNTAALPSAVVAEDHTVAFRVTNQPFAHALVAAFGRPVVSTSANLAHGPNSYRIEEVERAFVESHVRPDILIDAGELPVRPPSTVVRVSGSDVAVLRQGKIVISS